jgi:four helix bundle protein
VSGARTFTELRIWRAARAGAKAIFPHTRKPAFREDRRLSEQINDSADSVMANIAEGFGRGTQGEFIAFLGYAIGSLNETQSHLVTAYDRGYVGREDFGREFQRGTDIRKGIVRFITSMVKPGSGVKHMRPTVTWSDQVREIYERVTGRPAPDFTKLRAAPIPSDDELATGKGS